MVFTQRCVAPSSRQPAANCAHSCSGTCASDSRGSKPIRAGSRPASRASAAQALQHRAGLVIGPTCSGNQPSPSRPAQLESSLPPPNQIGIGRCTGRGLMPASSMRVPAALEVDARLRPQGAQHRDLLLDARPPVREVLAQRLVLDVVPAQPDARAAAGRRLSTSTSAACLATSAVCRCGRMRTPVTSSTVLVTRPGSRTARRARGTWSSPCSGPARVAGDSRRRRARVVGEHVLEAEALDGLRPVDGSPAGWLPNSVCGKTAPRRMWPTLSIMMGRMEISAATAQTSPWPRRIAIACCGNGRASLVATFSSGLAQFEGKGFGARLVAYPLMMLFGACGLHARCRTAWPTWQAAMAVDGSR